MKLKSATMLATSEDSNRVDGGPRWIRGAKGNKVEYGVGDTLSRRKVAR
jgi:hypothetical protein